MECLFGAYSYGLENVFARNKEFSGKHVVNSVQEDNNYRLLIKAVILLKQNSC